MTQLLIYREQIIKFYQKYESVLLPFIRFIIGTISFFSVNRIIGFCPELNRIYIVCGLGLVTAFLPQSIYMLSLAAFSVMNIFYASPLLAFVVAVIFLICYCVYLKFVPKHTYVIVTIPVLFPLYLAYGVPMLLGLIMTPLAVIPIVFGVGVYYLFQTITSVVSTSTDSGVTLYQIILQQFLKNEEMYVVMIIFSIVAIVIYIIRNRERDYAFEIAIFVGAFLNIALFLCVNIIWNFNFNVVGLFFGSVGFAFGVLVAQFMRLALNYAGVENLQFEDEEYYYYVRAVPKINVAAPSKRVKKFSVRRFTENLDEWNKKQE